MGAQDEGIYAQSDWQISTRIQFPKRFKNLRVNFLGRFISLKIVSSELPAYANHVSPETLVAIVRRHVNLLPGGKTKSLLE